MGDLTKWEKTFDLKLGVALMGRDKETLENMFEELYFVLDELNGNGNGLLSNNKDWIMERLDLIARYL